LLESRCASRHSLVDRAIEVAKPGAEQGDLGLSLEVGGAAEGVLDLLTLRPQRA
jgi:hypothetical protein